MCKSRFCGNGLEKGDVNAESVVKQLLDYVCGQYRATATFMSM